MKMSLEEATMKALLGELDDKKPKDDVEGIVDGIMVVTDPEITPDEYEEVIENAQEILEDTPEGEVPFNDQYVGEYLLTCPICGSSFINKEVLNVGDSCPICTEVPEQGFILNGQVATQEDVELQNDIQDEKDKEENDDVNVGFEEVEEEPISEEDVEEAQEELVASEVQRTADNKLEEVKVVDASNDDEFKNTVTVINNTEIPDNTYNLKIVNYRGKYFAVTEDELEEIRNIDDPWRVLYQKARAEKLDWLIDDFKYAVDTDEDKLNENYVLEMTAIKLNENKQLAEDVNKYKELKNRHQEEFNKFPIKFAFSNQQFKEAMEELGLTENDTDKVVGIGASGFIRKSDVDEFNKMNKRHREEEKEAMDADTTGEGYIKDMFEYELANHEYGYTYDLDDTLDALGLTIDEINNDPKLKHGLDLALKRYKDSDELDESRESLCETIDSDEYVRRMKEELPEINTESVVNWCKKQLRKGYSEQKLTQLEIARDTILDELKESKSVIKRPEQLHEEKELKVEDMTREDIFNLLDNGNVIKVSKESFTPGYFYVDTDKTVYVRSKDVTFGWEKHPTMSFDDVLDHLEGLQNEGFVIENTDEKPPVTDKITESKLNFIEDVDELPDMCYAVLPSDNSIIVIKKNENTYYETDYEKPKSAEEADEIVNRLNSRLDVTPDQRFTMELRSMSNNWKSNKTAKTESSKESKDTLKEIKDMIDWLATHNKNYTKEQYYKILDLQDLVDDLSIDKDKKEEQVLKVESSNDLSAEEKLAALYEDYRQQGMLPAFWTDLLGLIDDFDRLDIWYKGSYPDEDETDLDEEWEKLEEE